MNKLSFGYRANTAIANAFQINTGAPNGAGEGNDALATFAWHDETALNLSASGHVSSSLYVGIKALTATATSGIDMADYNGQANVAVTLDLSNLTLVTAAAETSILAIDDGSGATRKVTRPHFLTDAVVTNATLNGTLAGTAVKDEDDMASNSATAVATQQSIKAYVDAQTTAQDLDFQGDSGGALAIDLDSETLDIAGGSNITTAGAGNTLTVNLDNAVSITSLSVGDGNITNVGSIALDSIVADNGTSFSMGNNWTNAGRTVADLGIVTTADINGGTVDAIIGGTTPADASFTTLSTTGLATLANATITGDLTVNGTTTTINTATLQVEDKNVEIGRVLNAAGTTVISSDATAAGGGITLKGDTDKTINWTTAAGTLGRWTSSENMNLSGTHYVLPTEVQKNRAYYINGANVLNATTLGTGVIASSLTSLGTIGSLVATTADINAGTVDATIGATTPYAGTFTTIRAATSLAIGTAVATPMTEVSDDDTMLAASNTKLATQQSIKAYVDAGDAVAAAAGALNYSSDTGNGSMALATDAMNLIGGEGMNVTHAVDGTDDTFTFAAEIAATGANNAAGNKGVASFDSGDFAVSNDQAAGSNGHVTIKAAGVDNAQLANSSLTIGSTSTALGATSAGLAGLTGLDFTAANASVAASIGANTLTMGGVGSTVHVAGTLTAATFTPTSVGGHMVPSADSTYNLGSQNLRWQNIYTGDLHLKNERGDWTIYEESDHLKVRNNLTGKMYKMGLTPVDSE